MRNKSLNPAINYRLALSLGGFTAINILLTGLIHAYVLIAIGPGVATDALFAGASVPQFLIAVISGSLVQVIIPLLGAGRNDEQQFRYDAWTFLVLTGTAFTALALLLGFSSQFWIPLLFPGLSDAGKLLARELVQIQLVGMVFAGTSGVLRAIHYARERFLWPELAHLTELIAGFGLLIWALPTYGVQVAAWVTVARGLAQTLLLLPGLGWYCQPDWRSAIVAKMWLRLRPLLLGTVYYKTSPLVDRFLSSMVPAGGLSLFFLSHQICGGINDVISKAITAPMVPLLVRAAIASNWSRYRSVYQQRLVWILTATFLGYLLLVLVGERTLAVVVGHGGITETNVKLLWGILIAMGGYVIAASMGQVLANAFYAQGDTVTPATVGAVGFTVGTGLKVAGFMEFGLIGVAIGATLHQLFNTLVLFTYLEIKFKKVFLQKEESQKVSNPKREQLEASLTYGVRKTVPCPLCSNLDFRILASNDRYNMRIQTVACGQCGLVMTNPMPSEDAMREFYKYSYRQYYRKNGTPTMQYIEEFNLAHRARYTLSYLEQQNLVFEGARILDVGCGEGSLLKEIKRRAPSIQIVGVEPDVAFATFARDYLKSNVYSTLAKLSESGESAFDLIILSHVLEHVENPVDLLRQLTGLMDRYGSIYVDVPDVCAYTSLADLHIAHRYHFSMRTLFATAHKAELLVADADRHAPPYHPRSIRCLLKRQYVELTLPAVEQNDGDVYDRIIAINRWGWCYHLRRFALGLGLRRFVKAFRAAQKLWITSRCGDQI